MKITQTQLEQVNDRMQALIRSNSFYGKKLEAAGMTEVHTPEEFAKLPFSEKWLECIAVFKIVVEQLSCKENLQ